jgi:hypothetical protein
MMKLKANLKDLINEPLPKMLKLLIILDDSLFLIVRLTFALETVARMDLVTEWLIAKQSLDVLVSLQNLLF